MNLHAIPIETMTIDSTCTYIISKFGRLGSTQIMAGEDEFYSRGSFVLAIEPNPFDRQNPILIRIQETYDYQDVLVIIGKTLTDIMNKTKEKIDEIIERGYWNL